MSGITITSGGLWAALGRIRDTNRERGIEARLAVDTALGALIELFAADGASAPAVPRGLAMRLSTSLATTPETQAGPGGRDTPPETPPAAPGACVPIALLYRAPPAQTAAAPEAKRAARAAPKTRRQGRWSKERMALLADRYPTEGASDALMEALNGLPGQPVQSRQALYAQAARNGIRIGAALAAKMREERARAMRAALRAAPAAEAAPAPPDEPSAPEQAAAPTAAIVAVKPGDEKAEAFGCFDAGQSVRAVAEDFSVPVSTAANWHAEWKAGMNAA